MNKVFFITTSKCRLTVSCDGELSFSSILRGETERLIPCKIPMPKAYSASGEIKDFTWKAKRVLQENNTVSALYRDTNAGCIYTVTVSARDDLDGAFEFSSVLTNTGADEIRIYPDSLFELEYAFEKAPTLWRFMKESGIAEGMPWSKGPNFFPGTGIYKDKLGLDERLTVETTTVQDFNSGGMIPMVYFDADKVGAYLGVEWTSQRIICRGTKDGVRVSVDYHDGFTTRLPSGERFTVAPIYVGVYDGDVDDGSNLFKRWFFLEKTPKNVLYDENEPLIQQDTLGQCPPSYAAELGVQCLKWDYGWWSDKAIEDPPTLWKYHEGSWKLRWTYVKDHLEELGLKSLEEYGAHLKSLGLSWTVYMLLHDSLCETEGDDMLTSIGANAHPEWFTDVRIAGLCPTADLGNKDCVEYCKRKLLEFMSSTGATGWRTDFEPIARSSDKENRHDANGNDVQYWCSRGFYEIVDHLIENLPGFRYESCSSGGSMKDFATMRRATVFNTDDSADLVSLRTTFYDSSYCFPPAQLQLPLDVDTFLPEAGGSYSGHFNREFGFRNIIAAPIMAESHSSHRVFNPDCIPRYGLSEDFKKYFSLHNEVIKPLIRHGNLYHILPRPDNVHWDGIQYAANGTPKNGVCGAAFIFKPTDEEGNVKRIFPRGLSKDVTYKVRFYERTDQSFIATGEKLMSEGFEVVMTEPIASDIIFFEI